MPAALRQKLSQKKPAQNVSKASGNGGQQYTHFTQTEIDLATKWRNEGKSLSTCADLLGRSAEAVRENTTPQLVKKKAMKVKGRPIMITEAKFQKIIAATENMIEVADCRWEVTIDMIKRKVQFQGSLRTLQNAFRKRGYYFRRFREKLRLTPEDVIDRKQFGIDFEDITGEQWKKKPHGIIDNKSYPLHSRALQQLPVHYLAAISNPLPRLTPGPRHLSGFYLRVACCQPRPVLERESPRQRRPEESPRLISQADRRLEERPRQAEEEPDRRRWRQEHLGHGRGHRFQNPSVARDAIMGWAQGR